MIKHDFQSCLSSRAKSSKPARYSEIDRLEFVSEAMNSMRKFWPNMIGRKIFLNQLTVWKKVLYNQRSIHQRLII